VCATYDAVSALFTAAVATRLFGAADATVVEVVVPPFDVVVVALVTVVVVLDVDVDVDVVPPPPPLLQAVRAVPPSSTAPRSAPSMRGRDVRPMS
jgi:hypothetical protein